MHMYHFHRYTHTALSVSYGTVYTCPMGRLQRWCMYLVVCDVVLVIMIIIIMEMECGGEKGWTRVASVDAAKDFCPHG